MKKFLISLMFLSFCLSACSSNPDKSSDAQTENNSYTASRTATTNNTISDNNVDSANNLESTNTDTEIKLSSFSTKIYTPNDKSRQNNIRITCSKLNGTIVKSRRNFFFL